MDVSMDNGFSFLAGAGSRPIASWAWWSALSLAVHAILILLCYELAEHAVWALPFRQESPFIRVTIDDSARGPALLGTGAASASAAEVGAANESPASITTAVERPLTMQPATTTRPKARPVRPIRTRRPLENADTSVAVGAPNGIADPVDAPDAAGTASFGGMGHRIGAAPEPIDRIAPQYPEPARARGIEGRVLLSVVLDVGGRVEEDIRVVHSIPLLDDAAITAVRRWRFHPARDTNGHAVRAQIQIPVQFVLH
jgi:protein TonB